MIHLNDRTSEDIAHRIWESLVFDDDLDRLYDRVIEDLEGNAIHIGSANRKATLKECVRATLTAERDNHKIAIHSLRKYAKRDFPNYVPSEFFDVLDQVAQPLPEEIIEEMAEEVDDYLTDAQKDDLRDVIDFT